MLTAVFDDAQITGGARLVALALADRADDSGRCFPAVADIQRRAGLATERAVQKALRTLVRAGKLAIEPGGGRHRTNRYQLFPGLAQPTETPSGAQGYSGNGDEKPLRAAPRNPCARRPKTPSGAQPEPSVNHQNRTISADGKEFLSACADDADWQRQTNHSQATYRRLLECLALRDRHIDHAALCRMKPYKRAELVLVACGCDPSFAGAVARLVEREPEKWRGVADTTLTFCGRPERPHNPGAWIRATLRAHGIRLPRGGLRGTIDKIAAEVAV